MKTIMTNGKKNKLYAFLKVMIFIAICTVSVIGLVRIPSLIKNIIVLAVVMSSIITLWCVSLIMAISYWEELLKSKDPE